MNTIHLTHPAVPCATSRENTLTRTLIQRVIALGCLFLASFALPAHAAETDHPNYTLEVIVFETFALKSWTEEYWPEEIELPDYENAISLDELLANPAQYPQLRSIQYRSDAQQLTEQAARLAPQKGYRILFHQAWSQNTAEEASMPLLRIDNHNRSGAASDVSGTIKLYKSRYAHVDFDLTFERRIPDRVKDDFFAQQQIDTSLASPEFWRFKLKESRKIRPNQLHYLDHPLFGVLVQLRYNP
jgi:hypothetical protein